eukprot:2879145-Rhodomonas_salina.1
MKVVELCVAHPHHALCAVNPKSEVMVVEILLRTAVKRSEEEKNTDYDQLNHRWIKVSVLFIAAYAPLIFELRDFGVVI